MEKNYIFIASFLLFQIVWGQSGPAYTEVARFKAPNATQAVAVDSAYFYSISNSKIIKHDKETGEAVAEWTGPLQHLNSGIVFDGKLYCANSNYPDTPMASSLEIFDTKTLKHIESHSFGIDVGSFTWIDKYQGDWYLMFVHYENEAQDLGRGAEYTTLVKMDPLFRRTGGWSMPLELTEHLRPMSISGGCILKDGSLILSPHHFEELYIVNFPEMGPILKWKNTIEVPFQGQGLARDPGLPNVVYGIHRKNREVVGIRLKEL